MTSSSMSAEAKGSSPPGPAAERFLQARRTLLADPDRPASVSCPEVCCLSPEAVRAWRDADPADGAAERLFETLAPLGAQPLRLQPVPARAGPDDFDPPPPAAYCANQGTPRERAHRFADCVRALATDDGPTTLLVAPLAGLRQGRAFFPMISGTACASNPYVWSEYLDPQDGVARLALGLDVPLHDRTGESFVRTAALGAPQRRPEADFDDIARHSQRHCHFLDLETARVERAEASEVLARSPELPADLLLSADPSAPSLLQGGATALTFERLLARTGFPRELQRLLRLLSAGFGAPAEIAFACHPDAAGLLRIELHFARPMAKWPAGDLRDQLAGGTAAAAPDVLFETEGTVVGRSRRQPLDHLIYVAPERYARLRLSDRFEIARLLGRLNRGGPKGRRALLGPGRWCTTSPELGVPTSFAEIRGTVALVEIVEMHANLRPEVSRGIHLLNELAATDMLYLALFPGRPHNTLARERLERAPNRLAEWLPGAEPWAEVVHVVDAGGIELLADSRWQRAVAGKAGVGAGK